MSIPEFSNAKDYQRKKQILSIFHLFLTPAVLSFMLATSISSQFYGFASSITGNDYLVLGIYFISLSLYMLIFDLPVVFYSGFVLEHQFGLSNQNLFAWLKDFLKRSLLSFIFALTLLEGLYALIWRFPSHWWFYAWMGFAFFSYLLGKIFPVLIVPLFYKYGPLADESLKKRILDLAARFALPADNVYTLNLSRTTKKANAAFMGIGKTKRVVLSDTLLAKFSGDEIETVVAHELGHYCHRDIWRQFAFGLVTSFLGFWIVFRLSDTLSFRLGMSGPEEVGAMPLLFLIFCGFGVLLMPLQSGFSRYLERGADRFALRAFPNREAFISCMRKLAQVNLSDTDPHPLYEWYFYDHPSIAKRIRMASSEQV